MQPSPFFRPLPVALIAAAAAGLALLVLRPAGSPALPGSAAQAAPGAAPAGGGGCPMFGGSPARNMVNLTDKNIADDWDAKTKTNVKWVAKLGSRAYGGPVIAGGKVYVGTNNGAPRDPKIKGDKGVVMCFDEATGKFLWQHVNDKLPSGPVNDWPNEGICSTPCVEGDRVYYVTNRCEVTCATTSGQAAGNVGLTDEEYKGPQHADVVWRLNMMQALNVFPHNLAASSPVVVGDELFVVTSNGVDEGHINIPAPDAPSFLAVDKRTGKVLWTSNAPGRHIMHGQWSSPSYGTIHGQAQVVFPGGDGFVRGFDPKNGTLLWEFDCNPKNSKYELGGRGTRSDFIAAPVIVDDRVYIGTGQDPEHFEGVGHLWCIDPSKATADHKDISPVNDNFDPKAPANAKAGFAWHYGGREKDPKKAGRDYVYGRTMSSCAVHDGLCYAAELAGYLHCLDAKTGQKHWSYDLKGAVWGSPYWVDGKVYVATEDGDVYIFQHGPGKPEPKKIEMEQPIRSTTVAANGVLYVMTESNLYAIQGTK